MQNRSPALILSLALGGCLIILICIALVAAGGYLIVNRADLFALSSPTVKNQIVYVGNDFNIYVVDPTTATKTALTKDGDNGTSHSYDYPTWAPDNRHIAFVGINFSSGSATDGALYSVEPNGTKLTAIYKTTDQFPFYMYWAPDGREIAFLTAKSTSNLSLNVAPGDKEDSNQVVDTGSPFYWDWAPDSSGIFTHVGGAVGDTTNARLALLSLKQKGAPQPLSSGPGSFQAPQWSPDGKHLLYSTQDANAKQSVAVTNADGNNSQTLFSYAGRVSFAWAPAGDRIAYITTPSDTQLPTFGHIVMVDSSGQNSRDISNENALAFFWSPNGKRLAYLTVSLGSNNSSERPRGATSLFPALQSGQSVQLHWKVLEIEDGSSRDMAGFLPTQNFIGVLPYFDQYSRSITFWSPDSQSFVYSNRESDSTGSIWVADASGKSPPRQVGEGLVGFWSWK